MPEIVLDEVTGLLVPMGDVGKMADAICRLVADPALRSKMGSAGKQRVLEHFTTEQTVPQMEAVFERACAIAMRRQTFAQSSQTLNTGIKTEPEPDPQALQNRHAGGRFRAPSSPATRS